MGCMRVWFTTNGKEGVRVNEQKSGYASEYRERTWWIGWDCSVQISLCRGACVRMHVWV
jgi:hypothetical protein